MKLNQMPELKSRDMDLGQIFNELNTKVIDFREKLDPHKNDE